MIKDSVFSEYIPKEYFTDEKPITSEKAIADELDKIEKPTAQVLSQKFDNAVENAVDFLSKAIANQDNEKVKNYKWILNVGLTNSLWGEWLLGWKTGYERGKKEINKLRLTSNDLDPSLLQFNQPEPQSDILRNRPAEKAIKARTNTLAKDVSNSEWKNIKGIILDAIKPQSSTENPISRKELLERINTQLGDRKQKFKNRAERIARTELTFAYNAGRLDSYVRSGLVSGVKYQTIFDERRCPICASRQGIVVALDDVEGLAKLAIPTHPMCRCVWSPVLKEEFDTQSKEKDRQIKNRDLVPGKSWLAGAIIASILLPDELIIGGALAAGLALLVKKFGSLKLARAAIATQINNIGNLGKINPLVKEPNPQQGNVPQKTTNKTTPTGKSSPLIITPGLDLKTATVEQLRSLLPSLNQYQASKIIEYRRLANIKSLDELSTILNPDQVRELKAIARNNNIFNLLYPSNNLTPSSLWVNSGGIISRKKSQDIFKLIQNTQFNSLEDLLAALKAKGIDADKLNNYAINQFDDDSVKN